MTRYFYTCPIKAAYMAEYHDFDFEAIDYKTDISEPLDAKELLDFDYYLACQQYPKENKIYLKKGSEYLIQPKKGDYILLPDIEGFVVVDEVKKVFDNGNIETVSYQRPFEKGKRIIMREGKEFFMPEVEND